MVLNEASIRLGVSLRMTEDELMRSCLESCTGFINCTSGTNGDNPTEITRTDVDLVVKTLRGNNASSFLSGIGGENKLGTSPVRDSYLALGHTDLIGQLENCNGFKQKWDYPNQSSTLDSEWGCIANLRFLLSSVGSKLANASMLGADVYNIFCTGRESFAAIEQDQFSSSFIYRPAIYDGPLAMNFSLGWKMAEVPKIIQDLWLLRLRCTLA